MSYDETEAFLCACKGEPYTVDEWQSEVSRLRAELDDAQMRLNRARFDGVCLPGRFERKREEA